MNRTATKLIRRIGQRLARTGQPRVAAPPDLWTWLRSTQRIETVIDIGANNGDYARFLSSIFAPQAVYAFEPLPACQPSLLEKGKDLPNFRAFNVALSDHSGEDVFFQNSYPPASSLLPLGNISKEAFPETRGEVPTKVRVESLDSLLTPDELSREIFIKIDVQGVEDQVIRGGRSVFSAAKVVLIEMSFVPMYKGQPLFEEIHQALLELGFRLAGMKNQVDDPESGRPLFAHCLYVRCPEA